MSLKKRGLGRGLNDLGLAELLGNASTTESQKIESLQTLPLDQLQPGRYQPRQQFNPEALEELATSIRTQGIIQPIVVRILSSGRYEIIAGERRWRAAKLAGLTEIPVLIRDMNDESAIAVALIENLQRQDLNPIEQAVALQRLIGEFSMTHQQAADVVGKSRTAVTNLLRLLNLSREVRLLLEEGKLEMGHARALLALPEHEQLGIALRIVAKNLSVREVEKLAYAAEHAAASNSDSVRKSPSDPNVSRLQQELSDRFNARVEIQDNGKGKGRLVMHFHSLDELDGILEKIRRQ